jgi:cyclase
MDVKPGTLARTMRVLHPHPSVYAFYDGRVEGTRLYSPDENWIDDGGYQLGVAAYAIVDDGDALIYDTHLSIDHARRMREYVERLGAERIRVVLSHWHLDHIAGNEVFADVEMIAQRRTLAHLRANAAAIEAGTASGPPAIRPLVLPGTVFDERLPLEVGRLHVDLLHADIHSDDAALMVIPQHGLLFAGDTLEDTVTYVDEPQRLPAHLAELERVGRLAIDRILPNHGDPDVIADGGYPIRLIAATRRYITDLLRCPADARLREIDLREFVSQQLADGELHYFAPYEGVHRANVDLVVAALDGAAPPASG